ncbi:MAG TPA: GIY-YIG nuclease family protein [Microterricola sp.]
MYILLCRDGSLYTGSTWSLDGRLQQHQSGRGAKYTARRLPVRLVYYEEFDSIAIAFAREHTVQGWLRSRKDALIAGGLAYACCRTASMFPRSGMARSSHSTLPSWDGSAQGFACGAAPSSRRRSLEPACFLTLARGSASDRSPDTRIRGVHRCRDRGAARSSQRARHRFQFPRLRW